MTSADAAPDATSHVPVDGPLGRLFLHELAAATAGCALTEDLVWDALDTALAASVQRLWRPGDHPSPPRADALWREVSAPDLLGWWSGPMTPQQTGLEDLAFVGPRSGRPDGWWSTPPDVVLTSRPDAGSGACVHLRRRDGYAFEPSRPLVWDADASGARVYEVDSVDAWRALVAWAPRRVTTDLQVPRGLARMHQLQPDWSVVASRYDAVHVPVTTLLRAGYQPLLVDGGLTFLTGWHPDVTAWLNPGPLFRDGPRALRLAAPQR